MVGRLSFIHSLDDDSWKLGVGPLCRQPCCPVGGGGLAGAALSSVGLRCVGLAGSGGLELESRIVVEMTRPMMCGNQSLLTQLRCASLRTNPLFPCLGLIIVHSI